MEKHTRHKPAVQENETQTKHKASDQESELLSSLERALAYAEQQLAAAPNQCWLYVIGALKEPQVQSHFIDHILDSEVFRSAYWLNGESVPEEARLIFEFNCTEQKIALIAPRFLVHFNTVTGRVSQIEDPAPMRIPVGAPLPGFQYCLY
jgi:hypothetical protein